MPKPSPFSVIDGSITAAQGFSTSSVFCDIKKLGTGKGSNKGKKHDLAVIYSEVPATAAGMYTTSQVCAAPVKVCAGRTAKGWAQAIVVNSGNANACTGRQGVKDAEAMTNAVGAALGVDPLTVLVCSTGRIGVTMPMANVLKGIAAAIPLLASGVENAHASAQAIMTSDTRPKEVAVQFKLGAKVVRIGGMCKGAGMIQPGMSGTGARPAAALHATMLGFITTDAAIQSATLQKCLDHAVAQSFNCITVDGDMSTNDTVLVLANGLAGNKTITDLSRADLAKFQAALNYVTLQLAQKIVRDGEGATKFVTVRVHGAKTAADGQAAARAVANGALVKTSWFGCDPNWGRILGALGASSCTLVEEKIDLAYALPGSKKLTYALRRGQPTSVTFAQLCKIVANPEFELHVFLNLGRGEGTMYTCDLSEEYVDFNKGDVTDPTSLGG